MLESVGLMRAILRNKATQEDLFWERILENDEEFILIGYITIKYGERKKTLTLPKAVWELKTRLDDA